jgi:hypothetical protein
VVVLADDRDARYFAGARLPTTLVDRRGHHLVLSAYPELTPALPARLRDDDGMAMIPMATLEEHYRARLSSAAGASSMGARPLTDEDQRWCASIDAADEAGIPVTFRLDSLIERWGGPPTAEDLKRLALNLATSGTDRSQWRYDRPSRTSFIWLHEGKILALGDPADKNRMAVVEHHEVRAVESFETLVRTLEHVGSALNPAGEGGSLDVGAQARAVLEETGIAIDITMEDLRAAITAGWRPGEFAKGDRVRRSFDTDVRVRALLDDLLGREFVLPGDRTSLVFRLEAIRHAPLVHLTDEGEGLRFLANVGGGRLIRVSIKLFAAEVPSPVRLLSGSTSRNVALDGTNLGITLDEEFDANLEGGALRSVVRRREDDDRAGAFDYYDT